MFKKTLTYDDFDGVSRTEAFYFNLSEAELMELELSHPGGYGDYIDRIIAAKDQIEIIRVFKELLLLSYGEKSDDGRHFVKTPEIAKNFESSQAYSELFMALASDDKFASEFVNGVIPKKLLDKVEAEMSKKQETR